MIRGSISNPWPKQASWTARAIISEILTIFGVLRCLGEHCVNTNDDKHVQSDQYQSFEPLHKRVAEGFPPKKDTENAQMAKIVILSLDMLAEVSTIICIFSLFASKNPFSWSIFPIAKIPLLSNLQKILSQRHSAI